ncbi:MAG: type II toxin-antitoxin system VapC family toxin [Cellulomonadaceae bacterium]|nr:type II toxin-antitoxin system VapC family toxin [Cellulomonadaceae bacterium]
MSSNSTVGLVDTNILILRSDLDVAFLPATMAVSTISIGELAAGVQAVVGDSPEAIETRAVRLDHLQRTEYEFDPIPYDARAAHAFGIIHAAVRSYGRNPRRRVADLMIAATARANGLSLFTTNPRDYQGLDSLLAIHEVPLPLP